MPRGNPKPTPRARKPHKVKSIKLAAHLCPIAENSLNNATATIELGLSIVDYLAKQAAIGDEQAIGLLAHFGVEARIENVEPIVVWRKDGTEAAWIV